MKTYFQAHLKKAIGEYLDKHQARAAGKKHIGENKAALTRAFKEFRRDYPLVNEEWLGELTGMTTSKVHETLKRKS